MRTSVTTDACAEAGCPPFRHEHDDKSDAGAGNEATGGTHILQ
jgi:hypothetical protein